MQYTFRITLCLIFFVVLSCGNSKEETTNDQLFKLDLILSENFVKITVPEETDFTFPDSAAKKEPYKIEDFNADGKEDIMVYLGACGTGGCIYGLFLNQYDNYYKLAFMNYLKGAAFEKEKNGFLTIKSFEEVEAYNPSKLKVSVYKFDENHNKYKLDLTYVLKD